MYERKPTPGIWKRRTPSWRLKYEVGCEPCCIRYRRCASTESGGGEGRLREDGPRLQTGDSPRKGEERFMIAALSVPVSLSSQRHGGFQRTDAEASLRKLKENSWVEESFRPFDHVRDRQECFDHFRAFSA